MKRTDIFKLVHKGIRCKLYDISIQLQQTDFEQSNHSASVLEKLKHIFSILDIHSAYEDQFILPAIEVNNQRLVKDISVQHLCLEDKKEKVLAQIVLYKQAATNEARAQYGEQIIHAFNCYLAFKLQHICEEEEKLNAALWTHYTDEQIKQIEQEIISTMSTEDLQAHIQWMINGINNTELISWFMSVRYEASGKVFNNLLQQAEELLTVERWETIKEYLTEGTLLT